MRKNKSKGQGLVEFALTLPILLLLLLGILEMSRVIWAYITVQAAARDAARYAITGKPYILRGDEIAKSALNPPGSCTKPEGDGVPEARTPWKCGGLARAVAIKEIAKQRGQTLVNVDFTCDIPKNQWPTLEYDSVEFRNWNCEGKSGYFGVQVIGQKTPVLLTGVEGELPPPRQVQDYAGDEGLNVLVRTVYNVQMLTPIFQTILGSSITVRGEVQMLNEGVNPVLGTSAPPKIEIDSPSPDAPQPPCLTGNNCDDAPDPYIKPSLDKQKWTDQMNVELQSHVTTQGPYEVYLRAVKVLDPNPAKPVFIPENEKPWPLKCKEGGQGQPQFTYTGLKEELAFCNISSVKPGNYCLYSIVSGQDVNGVVCTSNAVAVWKNFVVIEADTTPRIVIFAADTNLDENYWAARSPTRLQLSAHEPEKKYSITLTRPGQSPEIIAANVNTDINGNGDYRTWIIPPDYGDYNDAAGNNHTLLAEDDPAPGPDYDNIPFEGKSPCPPGGTPCIISSLLDGNVVVTTTLVITEPKIEIDDKKGRYEQNSRVRVRLRDHTPNQTYRIYVRQYITETGEWKIPEKGGFDNKFEKVTVNSKGNSKKSLEILVDTDWKSGIYQLSSYPHTALTEADLATNWISAPRQKFNVLIDRESPRIDIQGDVYRWPVGSLITIQLDNHLFQGNPSDYTLFLVEKGTDPLLGKIVVDRKGVTSFRTDENGRITIDDFEIPADTVGPGEEVVYELQSYLTNDPSPNPSLVPVAVRELTIISQGLIRAYKGNPQPSNRVDDPNQTEGTPLFTGGLAVLPDDQILVQLLNHAPFQSYNVYYANKSLRSQAIQTNADGEAIFAYAMEALPNSPAPNLNDPSNWAIYYDLYSEDVTNLSVRAATTTLAIDAVNLIAFDANPELSTSIQQTENNSIINQPYTITFQFRNSSTRDISKTFDIDFFHNPGPLTPKLYQTYPKYSPPGDYKQWEDFVGGGATFNKTQVFTLTSYGVHTFYAQVDTSSLVDERIEDDNVYAIEATLECIAPPQTPIPASPAFSSSIGEQQTVSLDFNDGDISAWQGLGFISGSDAATQQGSISAVNGQMYVRHQNGKPNIRFERNYVVYYKEPLKNLDSVQVVVTEAPTAREDPYSPNNGWAGLELRAIGYDQAAINPYVSSSKVYMALRYNGIGYEIETGVRKDNNFPDTKKNGFIPKNQLPVGLRINYNRAAGTLSFQYKPNYDGSDAGWTSLSGVTYPAPGFGNQAIYASVFASNENSNEPDFFSETAFDDFKYKFTPKNINTPGWVSVPYGTFDDFGGPDVESGQLVLTNNGLNSDGKIDTGNNSYFMFHYTPTTDISTEYGFDVQTSISQISRDNSGPPEIKIFTGAGLEVRNDVDNTSSPKIQFMLRPVENGGTLAYSLYASYRNAQGSSNSFGPDKGIIVDPTNVKLQIKRQDVQGLDSVTGQTKRGKFLLYYNDTFFGEVDAPDILGQVDVGVFNASGSRDVYQTATFSDFKVTSSQCPAGDTTLNGGLRTRIRSVSTSGVPIDPAPGLKVCTNGLQNSGFENGDAQWRFGIAGVSIARGSGNNSSNSKLLAQTDLNDNPFFYQQFSLGDWIITDTTTLNLELFKNINDVGNDAVGIDQVDVFKAVVVKTPPNQTTSLIDENSFDKFTEPIEVTNGVMSESQYDPTSWEAVNLAFELTDGPDSLRTYNGDLYLLLYNNSNGPNCVIDDTCKDTQFFFDDIVLNTCTTQPSPTEAEVAALPSPTHISGTLRLNINIGGTLYEQPAQAGVPVWAYAANGDLYQTTTIAGGEFNFYGLPATPGSQGGTVYYLYAEQITVNGDKVNQLGNVIAKVRLTSDAPNNRQLGLSLNLFDVILPD